MFDLSVIIVSWNAKEFLLECLRSLESTTNNRKTEIIVVDNASTDGSPEAVQQNFPHVKLINNQKNLGFAKANNIGIRQSRGNHIFLINSDVKVFPQTIDHMLSHMKMHSSIGVLGPQILNSDLTLQPSCKKFPSLWTSFCRCVGLDTVFSSITFYPHDRVREVEMLNGCFLMVRRQALNQVGLLDENFFMYAEDKDWCKRFRQAGWDVVYFPEAQAIHYGGASSSNAPDRFYVEIQRANLQYWKKHHSRLAQLLFFFITLLHQIIRLLRETMVYLFKPESRQATTIKMKRFALCLRWLLGFSRYARRQTHGTF